MGRGNSAGTAAAIAIAFAFAAAGQEYAFRTYGSAEGLGNLVVLSLAQDHAGYIWAGTEAGLYRYDGTYFRLMGEAEGLPCSTEVHTLFVASGGALWANTCNGIFVYDGHRFAPVDGIHELPRGAQIMTDAPGGGVLITAPDGILTASRAADGSFHAQPYPLPARWAGTPARGIVRQGDRVWFGCGLQLCLQEAGQLSVFGVDQGVPEASWDGIQIAADGTVWARSAKGIFRRAPRQSAFSQENPGIGSSGFWGALIIARDGSVMVPTDQGLAIRGKAGWSVVNRAQKLRTDNAVAVMEDREGSVWIGLAGGGLARWIGRGVWESWTVDQGLPSNIVWNIRRDKTGALWVGTSVGLTRIEGPGQVRTWTKKDGLGGDNVRWLAETSGGFLWAAIKPGGLARIETASGKVRRVGARDGLPCDPEDVFVDRSNRLWIPTTCGLFVDERPDVSTQVTRVETPESFGRSAWKVLEDRSGTIWVNNGKALWSLREGIWREHGRAEGLPTANPYVMALANDGSIWLRHRYDGGIDRLEVSGDRITGTSSVVPADPRAAGGTAFHGFDAFGNFWRGTSAGVEVLHGKQWTKFTTEDGLVSNDCDGEAFWSDADGGVWMGTSGGLSHYLPANAIPPAPPSADPTIVRLDIDQGARLVRAGFSTLNYRAEQLAQFAYRLDSAAWTESPERNVVIHGLGPGLHRLEVRGRVRDSAYSAKIATVQFEISRRWNETWWARTLGWACGLAAIALFVRWRARTAERKQAELESIVAARTTKLRNANLALDEAAKELRKSEEWLKNAERLAHVGHWNWDVKTGQLSWSQEVFRIFGVSGDYEPSYKRLVKAVAPQDRERLTRWISGCLARSAGQPIEFRIARPSGEPRILSCTSEVSLDGDGMPSRFFGACQDITDSRQAQQEDFARKKLESIGILAGGIAHDFNNLMGAVVAQAELALDESGAGRYPDEALTAIRDVAMRGSEIVRQLMIYAGKETEVPGPVDISQVVIETFELLRLSVSKQIVLVKDLGSELPPVWASRGQIRQVIVNIVTNASDAIGDRPGEVRVTTRCVTPDDGERIAKGLTQKTYIRLEVSDTGCGMAPEIQSKVFDPFFTTRGAGHGMGLAVVDGAVRSLCGAMHVDSEPGRGTTFHVWLPCAEATPEAADPSLPEDAVVAGSAEESTVLVVEDEDTLRVAVTGMLRKANFSVMEAADGSTAIELLRANCDKIDVILLDMTIPGASSDEVLAAVRQARKDIRVVLTSAYSREMLMPSLGASQVHGFIRKPYRLGDLVQRLRQAAATAS